MIFRKLSSRFQAACLSSVIFSLIFYLVSRSPLGIVRIQAIVNGVPPNPAISDPVPPLPSKPVDINKFYDASARVEAILDPGNTDFDRLACPVPNLNRYDHLKFPENSSVSEVSRRTEYFFALLLHNNAHVLPRLLGSIVEAIRFLGPENCVLSVVEGRSDDGTYETLKLLRPEIEHIPTTYFFTTNEIHPKNKTVNRVAALAELRNQALQPLLDHPDEFADDATIIFSNDVALCLEDILELVHQRRHQQADMTCAMDWKYMGANLNFYDVWISRGMSGDTFFHISPNASWAEAWNIFWNDPDSSVRLLQGQPFQVFSCWNGISVFTAKPLFEGEVKFRGPFKGECYQGEPQLLCKDLWYKGYGKIAVVPSINVGYTDAATKKIKKSKGYVSNWTAQASDEEYRIQWKPEPPKNVKCVHTFHKQTWRPWDEQLAENGVYAGISD